MTAKTDINGTRRPSRKKDQIIPITLLDAIIADGTGNKVHNTKNEKGGTKATYP